MPDISNNNNHSFRFFADSSIFKKTQENSTKNSKDPVPFGLDFQEALGGSATNPQDGHVTMGQSPTSSITGTDNGIDVDYQF